MDNNLVKNWEKSEPIIIVKQYTVSHKNILDKTFILRSGDFLFEKYTKALYIIGFPSSIKNIDVINSLELRYATTHQVLANDCILFDNSQIDRDKVYNLLYVYPEIIEKMFYTQFYNKHKHKKYVKTRYEHEAPF